MLKRTITGFFILLFTVGFIALRQVSPLFFDAFMLVIMYGSVVEMSLASKFSDKKIAQVLVFLYPAMVACIYIFSKTIQTALLLQIASALLMFALLMASELIENAIVRKQNAVKSEEEKELLEVEISEEETPVDAENLSTEIPVKVVNLGVENLAEVVENINEIPKKNNTPEIKKQEIIKEKNTTSEKEEKERNAKLLNQTKYSLYIMLYPTTLLGFLMGVNHFGLSLGYVAIIMTFAVSMMTDVFAYLFGSLIRGAKFAPEISPKKSVAGMIFGALGGMLASGLGYLFFVHFGWLGNAFAGVSQANVIVTFVLMGVFGTFLTQFGDLVASAYKRKVGIKDFGSIFPGHGGFMDRVDGLMFTGVLVYVLFALFII